MAVDPEMQEIVDVFLQESFEGLDVMEARLLNLDDAADGETINTIFRAAHSIKGGAATLGFTQVSDFTHGVETLLDEMRDGRRAIAPECIQALLASVDVLRDLISAIRDERAIDEQRVAAIGTRILHLLSAIPAPHGGAPAAAVSPPPAAAAPSENVPAPAAAAPGSEISGGSGSVTRAASEAGSIRVSTTKVDQLVNLVGELVITQSMLTQFGNDVGSDELERLRDGLNQLARNTRDLQESVMKIRMLPIGSAFNRIPRIVHDLSFRLGKKVDLKVSGESTELDKTVLEKISDPLIHLVRNALDHGLEKPQTRLDLGKPERGTIELSASHEGGNIVVEVRDDGAGLNKRRILERAVERGLVEQNSSLSDEAIHKLIFLPGFSTAEAVSDVSGRGVGMDVVRRNIEDLAGHVSIQSSEGCGSTVRIRLPLTLAILEGQLVRVGDSTYVLAIASMIETIKARHEEVHTTPGGLELFRVRGEHVPIVRLRDAFQIDADSGGIGQGLIVIVESDGCRCGLLVDELLAQQQVVIKSLEANFQPIEGIAGATILANGRVALIVDVAGVVNSLRKDERYRRIGSTVCESEGRVPHQVGSSAAHPSSFER